MAGNPDDCLVDGDLLFPPWYTPLDKATACIKGTRRKILGLQHYITNSGADTGAVISTVSEKLDYLNKLALYAVQYSLLAKEKEGE